MVQHRSNEVDLDFLPGLTVGYIFGAHEDLFDTIVFRAKFAHLLQYLKAHSITEKLNDFRCPDLLASFEGFLFNLFTSA